MARLLLLTYGSRGDVEPFVALGLALRAAGHAVTLATAPRFEGWAREAGLAFAPIDGASLDLIDSPAGQAMIEGTGGLLGRVAAGARLSRGAGELNARMMADAAAAAGAVRPEALVFHPKAMAGGHLAEALRVPAFLVTLQPLLEPTAAFSASLGDMRLGALNRASYRLVSLSYAGFRGRVNAFRAGLGLPPIRRAAEVMRPPGAGEMPLLHAISPKVLPRPADWPARAKMTGFWRLPPAPFEPPPELAAFLAAGPPPVFVGFGSMPSRDPEGLGRLIAEALALAGRRGVVARGWAGLEVAASENLLALPPMPYAWLFPRMAAVVHHGGAGTTAEAFHAGVPQAVVPFFADQPFWAARTVALGVGAPPLPRRRLTAARLADAIRATDDPDKRDRAQALAEALSAEDGLAETVCLIEAAL
ncbi:glycosyltransferase [Pseudoroseicyclus sp. CXY001]|uniref:glycosyltransferase n=1 Tax=Pseudoroseicyclus sp. CXY001 TaxID=3242492 RepID=UPI003570C54E